MKQMKRVLLTLIMVSLVFLFAVPANAQSPGRPRRVPTKPAGTCNNDDFIKAEDTGVTSICQTNGTWKDVVTAAGGAAGDVTGPGSAADNAAARFDSTTGKLLQNSLMTIDDNGSVNIPTGQSYKINNVALAKGDVGLNSVDNTSDANKPVSTAQAAADALKLNLSGGTLTGNLLFTDNTLDIGASGATRPRTGYFGTSVIAPLFNAATGFQIGGAAASGNYLRGNATNFVSSAIQAGDVPTLNQNTSGTASNVSGTPALPNGTTGTSQAVDDNTAKLATDAFVLAQAASANPIIDGTAAPGTSTRYARGDHVHPTDTSRQATISFGTGVLTAMGVNVGTAGSPVVNGGALGSPSSAGTIPAFTLGGTVAGGGNQVNNVIIGTSTPLAGSFTTLIGSTSTKTPIIFPASDSTTAITITKADASTAFVTFDSSNKRVGINKTPGAFDLDVNGAANFGGAITVASCTGCGGISNPLTLGTTTGTLIGGTGTTAPLNLQSTSGVGTTGADIIFKVGNNGGTEAARIFNSGRFFIGAATEDTSSQIRVIGLSGSDFGNAIAKFYTTSTQGVYIGYNTSSKFGFIGAITEGSTHDTMYINPTGGTVGFNTSVYASCTALTTNSSAVMGCTASDRNLKDIKHPFTRGLEALAGLRPQTYSFKPSWFQYNNGQQYSSLVAQNVQQFIPEAVSQMSGGLQIDNATIIAVYANAINELKVKLDTQQKEIEALKAKVKQ